MEGDESVDHSAHGDNGEESGGDAAYRVTEIEESHGEPAEDDGEVKPRQEGALVGEENLGFDARGEGDAFPWEWVGSC